MENAEERQHIGEIIRNARKGMKMTQKELSNILGVRQDVISDYENGNTKVIPFNRRVQLSEVLSIDFSKLIYENENIPLTTKILDNASNALVTVRKTPYDKGKIDEIIDALSEKEKASYVRYFISLTDKCSLAELLYILFATLLQNRVMNETAEEIISNVIEWRFRLFGLQHEIAMHDAEQLALPLSYLYKSEKESLYVDEEELDLISYFIVDTTNDDFQRKLADALSHFNKREFN